MVNTIEETTYPDDKNILFYYLSMSSLQNKTKNCLRDKFFFHTCKIQLYIFRENEPKISKSRAL